MSVLPYTKFVPRQQWEYSLRQAAELASVSVDTIKRRLRAGDLPHARQLDDPARTWVVPLGDLVAAGFTITPTNSIQAPAPPLELRQTRPGASLPETRLAVAEAVQKVHADYARTLADLLDRAIAALGTPLPQSANPGENGTREDEASTSLRLPRPPDIGAGAQS